MTHLVNAAVFLFNEHEPRVIPGDTPSALGSNDERVFDTHHTDAFDTFLWLKSNDHSFLERLNGPFRDHREIVDLEAGPVAEEVCPPVAKSHEVFPETRC